MKTSEKEWREWEAEGEAKLWHANSHKQLGIEGLRRVNKKRKIELNDQVLIAPKEDGESGK